MSSYKGEQLGELERWIIVGTVLIMNGCISLTNTKEFTTQCGKLAGRKINSNKIKPVLMNFKRDFSIIHKEKDRKNQLPMNEWGLRKGQIEEIKQAIRPILNSPFMRNTTLDLDKIKETVNITQVIA